MKKLFILFIGLFYFSNSLGRPLAYFLGTTPVTVPSLYYYFKTKKIGGRRKNNEYKGFVGGAVMGAFPYVNAAIVGAGGLLLFMDWLEDNENDNDCIPAEKACCKGFLSGLSLYVTIPFALEMLRKCPK